MSETLHRYRGSRTNYIDIASRGTERLGIGLDYAKHPLGIGVVMARFVAHAADGEHAAFTHFVVREQAQFLDLNEKGESPMNALGEVDQEKVFNGIRLNKIAVPVFKPFVPEPALGQFGDKFHLWELLAEWIAEQVKSEGFLLTVKDLAGAIKGLLVPPATEDGLQVEFVMEFPDLAAYKAKKQTKSHDEDGEEEEPEEEEEPKPKAKKKGWLN